MRPSENQLYLVHFYTCATDPINNKEVLYAESPEAARQKVINQNPRLEDIVVTSVWQRVWSRGDD